MITAKRRGIDFGAGSGGRSACAGACVSVLPGGWGRDRAAAGTTRRARTNRCCVRSNSGAWAAPASGENLGMEIRAGWKPFEAPWKLGTSQGKPIESLRDPQGKPALRNGRLVLARRRQEAGL